MDLGSFSVSLTVADLEASTRFYESLGFEVVDGQFNYDQHVQLEPGQYWVMMQNGDAKIGLFQGMLEANVLNWNPPDVRAVQAQLKEDGVAIDVEAIGFDGPATVMLSDPDGNHITLDQY